MKQSDGWSKRYAAILRINKSSLRQSNTFDKSVLSKLFKNFFHHKKKAMLSAVTLSECILMLRENLVKVTTHLIKHTTFINFGENGKETDGRIIFNIKFVLLFMNGYIASLFQFWGKNEPRSELLKLWCMK